MSALLVEKQINGMTSMLVCFQQQTNRQVFTVTMLYHALPCSIIPYHALPYHTVPCCTMPYHALPCCTMPYHALPSTMVKQFKSKPSHLDYCTAFLTHTIQYLVLMAASSFPFFFNNL